MYSPMLSLLLILKQLQLQSELPMKYFFSGFGENCIRLMPSSRRVMFCITKEVCIQGMLLEILLLLILGCADFETSD